MKYEESKIGRVFVIRLEDGEIVHEIIETFAREHAIRAAALIIIGGADDGSTLVVGPREDRSIPVDPMTHILANAHEVAGTGTLFPDGEGAPILHMHMACGRREETVTGCIRTGVKVWRVMEVILFELLETRAVRRPEPPTDLSYSSRGAEFIRNLSQDQLAQTLSVKQAAVSKLEKRTGMYISTLRNFIKAMEGNLEIIATFPDGFVQISQFESIAAKVERENPPSSG